MLEILEVYMNRPFWAELLGLVLAFISGMAWAYLHGHRRK